MTINPLWTCFVQCNVTHVIYMRGLFTVDIFHVTGALTTGQSQSCPLPVTDAFQSRYPNLSAAVMQDKAGGIQRGHGDLQRGHGDLQRSHGDLAHTDTQQHRKNRYRK